MAWVTPVTNRPNGRSRMTYTDMNRITGNVSYLYNLAISQGYDVSGDDVSQTTWTKNDIISKQFWDSLHAVLNAVLTAIGLGVPISNLNPLSYFQVNQFEKYTLSAWEHLAEPSEYSLLQDNASVQIQTVDGVDIEAGLL